MGLSELGGTPVILSMCALTAVLRDQHELPSPREHQANCL